jgi:hypothetical protein
LGGTTIGIYRINQKTIAWISSQWRIMLVVDFNFRFNYTSQGFQGWNPKYGSSNIKETYGLVKVKCNWCS